MAVYPEKLKALCNELSFSSKTHRLVVVPGGGEFADLVRSLDERFSLSSRTCHRMAILGMDQYGLLLAELIPNSAAVNSLEQVEEVIAVGKLPIFLPSKLMLSEDPLENTWAVTSDSIAAYIAYRLYAGKLLLVTDVDGIFSADPKEEIEAKLIGRLSADELLKMGKRTSVDEYLP